MFYEMYVELAGDVYSPPQFKQDKEGKAFVEFWLSTNNQSVRDKKVWYWRCFAWDGEIFRQLKQWNLQIGDNIVVKGMFSLGEKQKVVHLKNGTEKVINYYELRCYGKYIKLITTRALMNAIKEKEHGAVAVESEIINTKTVGETNQVILNISDKELDY